MRLSKTPKGKTTVRTARHRDLPSKSSGNPGKMAAETRPRRRRGFPPPSSTTALRAEKPPQRRNRKFRMERTFAADLTAGISLQSRPSGRPNNLLEEEIRPQPPLLEIKTNVHRVVTFRRRIEQGDHQLVEPVAQRIEPRPPQIQAHSSPPRRASLARCTVSRTRRRAAVFSKRCAGCTAKRFRARCNFACSSSTRRLK